MHRQVCDEIQGRKPLFLRPLPAGAVDDLVPGRIVREPFERYQTLHKIPDHSLYCLPVIRFYRLASVKAWKNVDGLKASGWQLIWLGADSGNDFIREEILGKTVDNETLVEKCRYLHRIGIRTLITNMVGLPYETSEHFEDTIELNARIYGNRPTMSRTFGACPAIFVFDPFPGTPLWNECKE